MLNKAIAIVKFQFKRKFVRNVFTLQLGGSFAVLIGLIKSIILVRLLGMGDFGHYAVILAFVGTLTILNNLGQQQASMTFFAEALSKKDQKEMMAVIKYYLQITVFSFLFLFLCAVFAPQLAYVFYKDQIFTGLVRLAFIANALILLNGLYGIVLQATRRIKVLTILENTGLLLDLIPGVLLVFLGMGVAGIFWGMLFSNFIKALLYFVIGRRTMKKENIPGLRTSFVCSGKTGHFVRQGLWIALDKNLANFYPKTYLFLMSLVTSPEIVGLARLAINVASVPHLFFLPHVTRLTYTEIPAILKEGTKALKKACIQLTKHAFAVNFILSAGAIIVLPFVAVFFYGESFKPATEPMRWLILIGVLPALSVSSGSVCRVFKLNHIALLWNIVFTPVSLAFFWWLLQVIGPLWVVVWLALVIQLKGLFFTIYMLFFAVKNNKIASRLNSPGVP